MLVVAVKAELADTLTEPVMSSAVAALASNAPPTFVAPPSVKVLVVVATDKSPEIVDPLTISASLSCNVTLLP